MFVSALKQGAARTGALATLLAIGAGAAEARPQTTSYTCEGVRAFIASQGAVTMGTGARTYDRFVSGTRNCTFGSRATATYVPTRDERQCRVEVCRSRTGSDGRR